jgi:hypothetical protein
MEPIPRMVYLVQLNNLDAVQQVLEIYKNKNKSYINTLKNTNEKLKAIEQILNHQYYSSLYFEEALGYSCRADSWLSPFSSLLVKQRDWNLGFTKNKGQASIVNSILKLDVHSIVYLREILLKWCGRYGNIQVINMLLDNDINIRFDDDLAFRLSAEHGHLNLVKLLLQAGANVHANDNQALKSASKRPCKNS